MNILVTGASGFLGFEIAKALKDEGHVVFNFSRNASNELTELGISTRKGNLDNYDDVYKALEGIDAVFHVGGKVAMWGKWEDFYNTNVIGAKNIIRAMKERKIVKLVFTSTPSVAYSKESIEGKDESHGHAKEFLSLYAKSKAMAESLILEASKDGLQTCALRPHLIFGKRDKNIIPRLIEARKQNKLKIIGDGKNMVDIIHVSNAVYAHLLAFKALSADSPVNGSAYFIGQERPVPLWDFINDILAIKEQQPVTKKVPLKLAYTIGAVIELFLKVFRIYNVHPPMTRFVALQMGTSHYFSHAKAVNDFNYRQITSIEQALADLK